MRVFPFVIHSHDSAFYGIVLHNKKQNRRQFLLTPLKGCLCRQRNSRYVFFFTCFSPGFFDGAQQYLLTEQMKKKKWNFHISGSTSHKCLEWENTLLLKFSSVTKFILMRQTWTALASKLEFSGMMFYFNMTRDASIVVFPILWRDLWFCKA